MLDPTASIFETVQSDAELVRELRATVPGGMTQADLAEVLGYHGASMVSAVECGERELSEEALHRPAERWPAFSPCLMARLFQRTFEGWGIWEKMRAGESDEETRGTVLRFLDEALEVGDDIRRRLGVDVPPR